MDHVWMHPPPRCIKINVNGTAPVNPLENGNENGIGLVARDYDGSFLWGLMGPLKGQSELQAQLWAIHMALKWAFKKQIPKIVIESDNTIAVALVLDQEEEAEAIEAEGVHLVIQQINILSKQYSKKKEDGSFRGDWELGSVLSSRNRAAIVLSRHGMHNCQGLVEVVNPFPELQEMLDLDNGLGPHWPILEVQANYGNGSVVQAEAPQHEPDDSEVEIIEEPAVKMVPNWSHNNNISGSRGIVIRDGTVPKASAQIDNIGKGKRKVTEEAAVSKDRKKRPGIGESSTVQ